MKLDRIDARLLAEVQQNNRKTSDELGELIGLSATSVQRRLKRLREAGVIEADVSIVNPAGLERHLTMLILVSLDRERADIIDRFKLAIQSAPEIMSGYYVTGESDFVLIVTAKDMQEYEQFTRRFLYENDILIFKTMVVIDRVKTGFALPIMPEAFHSD